MPDVEEKEDVVEGEGATSEAAAAAAQADDTKEAASGEGAASEKVDAVKQFFDPNQVPAELKESFKRMQGAFTRAMQGLSTEREKVKLYDQLMSGDTEQAIKMLAAKAGLRVSRDGEVTSTGDKEDDSPTTRYLRDVIKKEVAPLFEEIKATQNKIAAESLISQLRSNFPDWYVYENEMATLLEQHPTLRRDPAKLYRLAKAEAEEVETSERAGSKSEQVITKPSTSRSSVVVPKKAATIEEAFESAKKQLGIKL